MAGNKIAILVSGGDAPGINACISGVLSTARRYGLEIQSVIGGLDGLLDGKFEVLTSAPTNICSYPGSIIPTGRSSRFRDAECQLKAVEIIRANHIDYLVIMGGEGSAQAANILTMQGIQSVCIPVSIDNDIWGTDFSVGFDSGVHQVSKIVADILQTAHAYPGRVFFIESMGGPTGHLALAGGLAAGADLLVLPEFSPTPDYVANCVQQLFAQKKESVVIVGGEGLHEPYHPGDQGVSFDYCEAIQKLTGIRARVTVMGYFMRGSHPTSFDSILGQLMGSRAVELLRAGVHNHMVVIRNNLIDSVCLKDVVGKKKTLNYDLLEYAKIIGSLVSN